MEFFDWPVPFNLKGKGMWKIISPCACWMTDRVIKETEKRKTAAWRNSVIAYWKAAGGEAWCPWHAWNSIQPLSNFYIRDIVPWNGWHFWAISCSWAKFMQHNTNLRGCLRLMLTSCDHHQNEVKYNSRLKYVDCSRKAEKGGDINLSVFPYVQAINSKCIIDPWLAEVSEIYRSAFSLLDSD